MNVDKRSVNSKRKDRKKVSENFLEGVQFYVLRRLKRAGWVHPRWHPENEDRPEVLIQADTEREMGLPRVKIGLEITLLYSVQRDCFLLTSFTLLPANHVTAEEFVLETARFMQLYGKEFANRPEQGKHSKYVYEIPNARGIRDFLDEYDSFASDTGRIPLFAVPGKTI